MSNERDCFVVRELLYLLTGHDCSIASFSRHGIIEINSKLENGIEKLVHEVIPLCQAFKRIRLFCNGNLRNINRTYQAFTSALKQILKEYVTFIAQLETRYNKGLLSLQSLVQYAASTKGVFLLINDLTDACQRNGYMTSGQLLTELHLRLNHSLADSRASKVFNFLFNNSFQPCAKQLRDWLSSGSISDPYHEFFIRENLEITSTDAAVVGDHYWQRCFVMASSEHIPEFFQQVCEVILECGKYLHIVNMTHGSSLVDGLSELSVDPAVIKRILKLQMQRAKDAVSVLMTEQKVLQRISSLKSYFFMEHGDMFLQFIDSADDELKKDFSQQGRERQSMLERLQSILELAQRTSSARNDPFMDELRAELSSQTLTAELFGILGQKTTDSVTFDFLDPEGLHFPELDTSDGDRNVCSDVFCLNYNVSWPSSLILTPKAIRRYQLIFRRLFHAKFVEKHLSRCWVRGQGVTPALLQKTRRLHAVFLVRQKMLNFVHNLQYYMTEEVLQPNWMRCIHKLKQSQSIDDMFEIHEKFLNSSLKHCLLTNPGLIKISSKLLELCFAFSLGLEKVLHQPMPDIDQNQIQVLLDTKAEKLLKYDGVFKTQIQYFKERLSAISILESEHKLAGLVTRLNFNEFYV